MKVGCLINNYNYGEFVAEAVDSALRQTVPFYEIIVVDDGSTDGSREMLAQRYRQNPQVQIVAKQNEGQLSCFNEGFARSTSDVVFFLDSDDVYEPDYVARSLDVYRRRPSVDFVYCGRRLFGQCDGLELEFEDDRDLGCSVLLSTKTRQWIGAPTSCLSMRRKVLEKILPLPNLQDWRTRADDCLVFGASLAGAHKYYLAQPLIQYRVHERNHYFGREFDPKTTDKFRLALDSLIQLLENKFADNVQRFAKFPHQEFRTIARPRRRDLRQYFQISASVSTTFARRLRSNASMAIHYLWTAIRKRCAEFASDSTPQHRDAISAARALPAKIAA